MGQFTVVTVSMPERHDLLAEACATVREQTIGAVPHLIRIEQPDAFGAAHVAKQRNAILKAVETPWIAVLDDDDLFDPNYLEVMGEHLEGADVVYSDCRGYPHPKSDHFDAERLRTNNYIDGEACIRAEALREVGGYPSNDIVEDWQLWVKLLDIGAKFVYVDQVIRTHRHGTLCNGAWRNVTG